MGAGCAGSGNTRRVEASLTLHELILDTAMNAFVSMDEQGRIIEWNRAAAAMFGWSREEAIGQRVSETIMPERFRDAHCAGLERFLQTGDGPVLGRRLELAGLRRDGSEFPIELTIQALPHKGSTTFHAFIADVSVRRDAERALERANAELRHLDELKSQFLAMASHELRTPLTAIEGFTSTMLHRWDQLEDAEKVRFLEIIDAQSHRLSRLVADLLTLSRVESGRLDAHPQALNIAMATKRVLRELDAGDAVVVDVPAELSVIADEDHLTQVLVNLISNAQKYGAPPIEVAAEALNGWIEISVCDHGTGVPSEFEPMLFEAFSRAPAARAISGSGLGLSIVRGLVEAQGGTVSYQPRTPTGSRFSARLPRAA